MLREWNLEAWQSWRGVAKRSQRGDAKDALPLKKMELCKPYALRGKLRVRIAELIDDVARLQPAHAEHIHGRLEGAIPEPVFAHAELAGAMIHGNLRQLEAGVFDECGNEAMDAFEGHQGDGAFAAHRLERAAGIANAIADEPAAHEVRDAAGDLFAERIRAFGPVAT